MMEFPSSICTALSVIYELSAAISPALFIHCKAAFTAPNLSSVFAAEEMAAGAVKAMSKLPEKTIITKRKISETKITETKISETMPGS